jgi:hypothetical protein
MTVGIPGRPHQQAPDLAVGFGALWVRAFHQVPGQRLLTATGVKLRSDADDRTPTKPTAIRRRHFGEGNGLSRSFGPIARSIIADWHGCTSNSSVLDGE